MRTVTKVCTTLMFSKDFYLVKAERCTKSVTNLRRQQYNLRVECPHPEYKVNPDLRLVSTTPTVV